MTGRGIAKRVRKLAALAGLEAVSPHALPSFVRNPTACPRQRLGHHCRPDGPRTDRHHPALRSARRGGEEGGCRHPGRSLPGELVTSASEAPVVRLLEADQRPIVSISGLPPGAPQSAPWRRIERGAGGCKRSCRSKKSQTVVRESRAVCGTRRRGEQGVQPWRSTPPNGAPVRPSRCVVLPP